MHTVLASMGGVHMSYRTTISIPDDLKAQMDAIGDRVNWSAIAATAFQAKVYEIQARKGKKMKKADIIKRLKAADEADTEAYDDGKEAGRQWAESEASPKELRKLSSYLEQSDRDNTVWWLTETNWNAPYGASDNLAFAIRPKLRQAEARESAAFWEEVLGEDFEGQTKDGDFLHGFGDGAAEVWEEVADEL
jgi:hypothetical protein